VRLRAALRIILITGVGWSDRRRIEMIMDVVEAALKRDANE
jgi:hypothetical protein